MERTALVLVDLTSRDRQRGLGETLARHYPVRPASRSDCLGTIIEEVRPFAICFEYDYPDISSLTLLKRVRQEHSSIPVLMLTEQHSEALAVWALRTRVWDYLVKPADCTALVNCLAVLKALHAGRPGEERRIVQPIHRLPSEARFSGPTVERQHALRTVLAYVHGNLNHRIRETDVATRLGMSRFQFSRMFKREYGQTFQDFVVESRMREAARLLHNPSASVTEVAWLVGFTDVSYFSRVFKRFLKQTPSEYRRSCDMPRLSLQAQAADAPPANKPLPKPTRRLG